MQKPVNNAYGAISALIFLGITVVFYYIDLKALSCRIEWSLFQIHSLKHARVKEFYHKATIVAFQVKLMPL